ncbi:MAG: O-antigen ligase family protein [Candidatus Komeilibacteria bacterium]
MARSRIILLWLAIFLLPWQARYFLYFDKLDGQVFEAGQYGLYASSLIIILTFIFWLLQISWPKRFWWYVSAVVVWLVISGSAAVSPLAVVYLSSLLLVAALLWLIIRSAALADILGPLVASGVMQAVLALIQFYQQQITAASWLGMAQHLPAQLGQSVIVFHGLRLLRAYGSFPHPNILAGFLVIACCAAWYLAVVQANKKIWRIGWCVVWAILYLGLAVTFSRAALIALVISWFIMFTGFYPGSAVKYGRRILLKAGVLLVFIFILLNLTSGGLLGQRFESGDRLEQMSITDRLNGLQTWTELMTAQPRYFVTGVGPYNYWQTLAVKWPGLPVWSYQPVHNIYLLLLAEWGILAWLILLFSVAFFWQQLKKIRCPDCLWRLSPLAALLVMGLFDHWIITTYAGLLLMAISCGLIRSKN